MKHLSQETKEIINNSAYKRIYKNIIIIRDNIVKKNKDLLNNGKTHDYQCNCNILKGIDLSLNKLPKP